MDTDPKFDDLFRIYCIGFAVSRGEIEVEIDAEAIFKSKALSFAFALGVEDGSGHANRIRSESQLCGAIRGAFDATEEMTTACLIYRSKPVVDGPTDADQIEEVVRSEASRLGSWTSTSELFAAVVKRLHPQVVDRHRQRLIDLCAEAAKRHNAGLEASR